MKKSKFILSALLVGYLATTSCKRDSSIEPRFSVYISASEAYISFIISPATYRDGELKHEAVYTDDKNSFLVSKKGDTIRPGQTFDIPHVIEDYSFDFYSEDIGIHNLKFTFKNSEGFTVTKEKEINIKNIK